jgi:KRAB domain-containing zinc finger protein
MTFFTVLLKSFGFPSIPMDAVNAETSHPCPECSSVFRKSKHLRYHVNTVHSTVRNYKCDQCENAYKRSSHLRRHIQNSHSSLHLPCEVEGCTKIFHGREQLRKHMRRHETKGSHGCELCGKLFSKKRQVESHVEKIHGPFPCKFCDLNFYSRKEFRLHVSTRHPATDEEDRIRSSHLCSSTSSSRAELQSHVATTHTSFPCNVCGSRFSRARDLRIHISGVHRPDATSINHACNTCGLSFSSSSNLNTHIRTVHQGLRKYSCSICGDSFAYKHVLQRHIRTQHAAKDNGLDCEDSSVSNSGDDNSPPSPVIRPKLRTLVVAAVPDDD